MTPRQAEVLAFIRDRLEKIGVSPTLEETATYFDFSRPRASVIISALVDEGYLVRRRPRARGVSLPGHIELSTVGTDTLRGELARRGVTLDALATPTVLSGDRHCAANLCGELVRPGQLMCRDHWFELPPAMRSAIMNAWRSRQMQAYQQAVEAARDRLGGFTRVVERVD